MRRTRLILSAACQRLRLASCLAATVTMRHDSVSCGAAGVEPGAGNLSCQQRYIQQSPQQWSKTPCKIGCSKAQGSGDGDTDVPLSMHCRQRCRHNPPEKLLVTRQLCRAPDHCPAAGVMQGPDDPVNIGPQHNLPQVSKVFLVGVLVSHCWPCSLSKAGCRRCWVELKVPQLSRQGHRCQP